MNNEVLAKLVRVPGRGFVVCVNRIWYPELGTWPEFSGLVSVGGPGLISAKLQMGSEAIDVVFDDTAPPHA